MDLLTFAANAIFSTESKEDTIIPVTPTKGARPVFGEVTNTIGISPEKFSNSPLRALFMSPTLNTPTTKLRSLASAVLIPGSRSIIGRGNNGKSLSYPSPEVQTPNGEGMSPHVSNGGLGKSPLTPMSNLKLLTRIASMEESLTSKKVLFQSINDQKVQCSSNVDSLLTSSSTAQTIPNFQHHSSECLHQSNNQSNTSTSTHLKHTTSSYYLTPSSPGCLVTGNLGNLSSVDEISSNRSSEGSRKDKSLGLLSEKFLEHFPMEVSFLESPRRLVIDEVASMLGTERRRVYDIINVLDSLSMAARVQKNMYQWMGKLHPEETLSRLKALGLKLGMGLHLQQQHLDNDFKLPTNVNANGDGDKIDSRREKSLGILCQKFLMLLLVSPEPHVISLDNAVRKLVGEVGEDGERLRTRGRRLYDIANVLTSLGLVKRVPTAKAFQYVGPEVTAAASEDVSLGVLHRHSLLPSRLGSSGGKENISLGDHDVTPSNITPPVQKRGRPRKLSSDFSASTLPVAKRSKIQRTRSEDINTSKPTRKFTRHPSLHDICQVAEVEREKLIQEEQLQQSHSNREMILNPSSYMSSLEKVCKTKKAATKSGSEALSSRDASVTSLQRRLTSRTKIPAALTFQGTCGTSKNKGQISAQPEIEQELTKQSGVTGQDAEHHIPISSHHNFEGCKVSEDDARKTIFSTGTWQNKFCSNSQNLKASPKVMVTGRCSPQSGLQSSSHGTPHTPNASKSMQVIKVITRTGISNQHNSSTVITVLPVAQNCNQSSAPPNLITNVNGGFHHMSTGTYTNGQKVVGSNDSVTERVAVSDSRESMCNPYAVYTVSNNHIGQRTFGRVSSSKTTTAYSSKNGKTFCDNSPPSHSSQPSVVGMGTNIPLGPVQHQLNISAGQKSSDGCDQNSWWQPSPDASSTDSELEEIFGNSFNFTRPKNLVGGVVSHERDGTNEEQV
ncbi:hypothetical protein OTU49_008592 [Cherax quadricarinatus]|uniref:E2F/DP family winged-helix DNA-binding domain-containing protein n=2 Tax=Cherax quadricarinatus TaxID=27406 RepID=A0AAW0WBP1_CHEQU